jgi:cobalamin synthase
VAFGALALRAVGGATGDVHGAATKVVEVAVYVGLVAAWG